MSVTLINGDGNPKVLAAQDSDWYATLTEQTTCILKVNGNLEATITDANTIEIDSGVCISKEGRRVQIDSGDIVEIIIPTGTQGVDTYYIVGFHLYIDDEGTQVAETFCQTMESSSATITETTFKEGSSSIYLSLYRVKREGLSLASVSRIVPLMDLPSNYIAEHEEGATASQNYSVGDYFTNAGSLKKVIATITSGDSISDSNTSDTTVASELSRINSDLSAIRTPRNGNYIGTICFTGGAYSCVIPIEFLDIENFDIACSKVNIIGVSSPTTGITVAVWEHAAINVLHADMTSARVGLPCICTLSFTPK